MPLAQAVRLVVAREVAVGRISRERCSMLQLSARAHGAAGWAAPRMEGHSGGRGEIKRTLSQQWVHTGGVPVDTVSGESLPTLTYRCLRHLVYMAQELGEHCTLAGASYLQVILDDGGLRLA